jgi:hypothetical protein
MDQSHAILLAMRALVFLLALSITPAIADDGAASIAAGGLVMRREPRITMAREVLTISTTKVTVDYDFRNDSDADITTEVAFPIPPYSADSNEERTPSESGFDSFKLWVNDRPVKYQIDVRAFVGRHDVTATLNRYHLDISTLGSKIDELPTPAKAALTQQKMLATAPEFPSAFYPNWTVHKRYYWSQIFPAHGTIHIRHTYIPVVGYSQVGPDIIIPPATRPARAAEDANTRFNREEFTSLCPSPASVEKLSYTKGIIEPVWVDFILTTANTWKRPIEDFTLIVERPDPKFTVSFCWDGPVEKLDANRFQAHTTNFIPTKELHIGFYHLLPPEKP